MEKTTKGGYLGGSKLNPEGKNEIKMEEFFFLT